jgi:hypothetical protein
VCRLFVFCFNVTPEFATSFKFQKSRGDGYFGLKYMEAAFNKEAESGEFFLEFEEKVWEHKLIEAFQSQGAGQVSTITFANNDGGDSAANALLRILTSKTGITCSRGTCPPALLAKVQAKQAAARAAVISSSKEFDEKTMAVIKQSLEDNKEVMVKVEEGIQSQVVKLDGIENGMQSQVVKLEGIEDGMQSQVVKLDGIQDGVCNVIPDYQREIALLKSQLAHKTALCDTVEGKLAHKTRMTNQQSDYISKLEEQHKEQLLEQLAWSRQGVELENKIKVLQEQLDTSNHLRQMLEQARFTAEILSSTLADERAAKRQRGV